MSNGELLAEVWPGVPVCLCSVLLLTDGYAGLLMHTSVERHLITMDCLTEAEFKASGTATCV